MPSGTSLPIISFVRRLTIITLMTSKRTQVAYVNKDNDKIVIAQLTYNIAIGPMTHSKVKSTSTLSTKQISEPTCLLKPMRTCDKHQSFIALIFLGAKGHNPHSREKLPSTLKDSGDKSPYSVIDTNYSTGSCSGSPTRMSKEDTYPNHSESFTSHFLMIMLIVAMITISIEEQLAKMACVIATLTKTDEEKDMHIDSLLNMVKTQVQNTSKSS